MHTLCIHLADSQMPKQRYITPFTSKPAYYICTVCALDLPLSTEKAVKQLCIWYTKKKLSHFRESCHPITCSVSVTVLTMRILISYPKK